MRQFEKCVRAAFWACLVCANLWCTAAPSLAAQDESVLPEGLPNPLVFASGKPVTSAKQWSSRRIELYIFLLYKCTGKCRSVLPRCASRCMNETNPRLATRRLEPRLRFCSTDTKTGRASNCYSTRGLASESRRSTAQSSNRPTRTRISCLATLDAAACAAFNKESRMELASVTNTNRKSGVSSRTGFRLCVAG
jgi:hypothetical protein